MAFFDALQEKTIFSPYEINLSKNNNEEIIEDSAEPKIIKDLNVNNSIYNKGINRDVDLSVTSDKIDILISITTKDIEELDSFGKDKKAKEYIISKYFNILSENNILIDVVFETKFTFDVSDDESQMTINDRNTKYVSRFYVENNAEIYEAKCKTDTFFGMLVSSSIPVCITETNITKENLSKLLDNVIISDVDYQTNGEYINTKLSFQERKKTSTLVPDEIYNFFIHYVDKYGNITNGYKINNDIKYYNFDDYHHNNEIERVLIPIGKLLKDKNHTALNDDYYIEVLANSIVDFNNIPITDMAVCNIEKVENNVYVGDYTTSILLDDDAIRDITSFLISKYMFVNDFETKITWKELPEAGIINHFGIITNSKGESLFKVPFDYIKRTQTELNNSFYRYYEYPIYSFVPFNVEIPENYKGYFYSYEKLESQIKATGILTKYDLEERNQVEGLTLYNELSSQDIKFYCSELDVEDHFNLKFNCIRLEHIGIGDTDLGNNILMNGVFDDMINLNQTQGSDTPYFKYINIGDIDIKVAGDAKKNRYGLGTCIAFNIQDLKVIDPITLKEVSLESVLFPEGENTPRIYKASLMYITKDIYLNDDKKLIKCSNIIYGKEDINLTLDGYCTYNDFIIYNNNKVILNKITGEIYNKEYKPYYDFKMTTSEMQDYDEDGSLNNKFLRYVQMPVYKDYFFETKEFNNSPEIVTIQLNEISEEETELSDYAKLANGLFVEPINSIDLFKNKYTNSDTINPYIFTNYEKEDKYLLELIGNSGEKEVIYFTVTNLVQDEFKEKVYPDYNIEISKIYSRNESNSTMFENNLKLEKVVVEFDYYYLLVFGIIGVLFGMIMRRKKKCLK